MRAPAGQQSNAFERSKAAEFCGSLKADRGGRVDVRVLTEGANDDAASCPAFWKHLPGERKFLGLAVADIKIKVAEKGGSDDDVDGFVASLLEVSCSGSKPRFKRVASGTKVRRSQLKPTVRNRR